MCLVDTNAVSELRKGERASAGVRRFWRAPDGEVYPAAQTVGELRRGVENLRQRGDLEQAVHLENGLNAVVAGYADRILAFDADCAQVWGKRMSPHARPPIDKQIAAIALIHDLAVVTRNVDDFAQAGVRLINPFD